LLEATMGGCVALMYHIIDEPGSDLERQWCCSPQAFSDQMHLLRETGHTPVSMSRVAQWMAGGQALPPKAVCITIDDGTRCLVEQALPVLADLSFPAIAYVVTSRLGRENDWLQRVGWSPRRIVDASDLRELAACGIEIGSHSVTHPDLTVTPPQQVMAEMQESKATLEDVLGSAVPHFAYPMGRMTRRTRDAAASAGYLSACTVEDGRIHRGDDPYRLNRVEVYHWDDLRTFERKLRWASADPVFSARSVRRLARRALQRVGLYERFEAFRG
jgi:peptidoglycan/xylan/chitin deacetylase (PgdA/CDA1 family)